MLHSKRILTLALLCALLTSCGGTSETNGDTTNNVASNDVQGKTESVAEDTVVLPDKKFDGAEVMFLTALNKDYDWYSSYEIYAEEMNGGLINDAVFTRNQTIEELLDIRIAETKLENPHNTAKESLVAGDTQFDVVMPYINNTISLATQGLLLDLNKVDYLALGKPWWDQRANENLVIADKLFISTGDIAILDNECTMVMFFNKDIIDQYALESPYDLVKDHKWTLDKLGEMAQTVTNDTDGNGKLDHSDTWGLSIAGNAPISFYFGAGERVVDKDENGELALQLGTSRYVDVMDKVMTLCYNDLMLSSHTTSSAGYDTVAPMFNAGQVLFVTFALVDINGLRDSEYAFGILPYPLYNSEQSEYNNLISTGLVSSVSVPYNNENLELTGATLEALAYYSMDTLTTAYYDNALKTRYVRDEESGDMLDIIFATRVYDLGFISDWGGAGSLVSTIYNAKSTEYVSKWEAIQQKAETALSEVLETYAKLQ